MSDINDELREVDAYIEDIVKLRKYAELEGCEWGDEAMWLCNNAISREYISDLLYDSIKDEVRRMLSYAERNYVIKERPIVHKYIEKFLEEVN